MDKTNDMTTFVEVARCGSFSAAARHLKISPSTVSKIINRLENRLTVRLFNRSTRQVSMTEAGTIFLKHCMLILDSIDTAEEVLSEFGKTPKGELTINSTAGFIEHCLLPLLPEFQERYPQLTLNLQISGSFINLINEGADVAIRMGELKDTSMVARKLFESPRVICASPSYLKKHGVPHKPDDLIHHNCLRLSTNRELNQWAFRSDKARQLIDISGNFITDKVDVLHKQALQGGGIVRLANFIVDEDIKAGKLVPLLEGLNNEVQLVQAIYLNRKQNPSKIITFVNYLKEKLCKNFQPHL